MKLKFAPFLEKDARLSSVHVVVPDVEPSAGRYHSDAVAVAHTDSGLHRSDKQQTSRALLNLHRPGNKKKQHDDNL